MRHSDDLSCGYFLKINNSADDGCCIACQNCDQDWDNCQEFKLHAADIRLDAGLMNNYRDGILNYQIALKGGKTDVTVALCAQGGQQAQGGNDGAQDVQDADFEEVK